MSSERVQFEPVAGAAELFTLEFVKYLLNLHDQFSPRIQELREKRAVVLTQALEHGKLPAQLPSSVANTGAWKAPTVPEDLKLPGIEISGPASITGMFINALNPGPDGTRAEGDLDDDEDSAGHRFQDTVQAAWNRKGAVDRTLTYYDSQKNKEYKLAGGR